MHGLFIDITPLKLLDGKITPRAATVAWAFLYGPLFTCLTIIYSVAIVTLSIIINDPLFIITGNMLNHA